MVVIVTTMALVAVHYLFQTHTFFLKQPSGLLIENIDLRFYAVSIFALSGDLILLGIAWEFSSRFRRKIPLMLRIFSVLLMTMWLDVFLFVPGAFWETPDLLQNIYVSLLTRFTLTVLALPFLWLFFFWEQKNKGFSFEERPIFAIVQSFAILNEQDLMRIRADRSEEALRESETRFNLAFSKVPTPLMLHAEDGEILLVNEMWEGISGYPIKELPNIVSWTRRAYGENAPEIQHIIQKNFNIHSTVHEGEYEIRTKNGESKIWDFSSAPLGELLDGRKIVMSMAVDITARKKAEIEFIEQERRYREMIENVGLIATMLDSEGSIV